MKQALHLFLCYVRGAYNRKQVLPRCKRGWFSRSAESAQFPDGAAGFVSRSSLFTPFFLDTFSVSFPKFQVSASTAARLGSLMIFVL